jgi:hypothetical protein
MKIVVMKNSTNEPKEKKLTSENTNKETSSGKEHIDPIDKKETMEERAKRENWTDVVESHLGIDE